MPRPANYWRGEEKRCLYATSDIAGQTPGKGGYPRLCDDARDQREAERSRGTERCPRATKPESVSSRRNCKVSCPGDDCPHEARGVLPSHVPTPIPIIRARAVPASMRRRLGAGRRSEDSLSFGTSGEGADARIFASASAIFRWLAAAVAASASAAMRSARAMLASCSAWRRAAAA